MAIPAANSTRFLAESAGFHLAPLAGKGRRVAPGEGDSPQIACVERAPHPNPLPVKNGEREKQTCAETKSSGQISARCVCGSLLLSRYCLSAGAGLAGAAPAVVPGCVLDFGVTSRMPGGDAGLAGCVCAVWEGGVVPAWLMVVLFRP